MITTRLALICAVTLAALAGAPAPAQDLERGRMLHENHCRMCHDSIAYKRGDRLAKDVAQVKAQVIRWQTNTGLRLSDEDVNSITAYLAVTYYNYPMPTPGKY
jgi:mono/diheme cytochrome c family protein